LLARVREQASLKQPETTIREQVGQETEFVHRPARIGVSDRGILALKMSGDMPEIDLIINGQGNSKGVLLGKSLPFKNHRARGNAQAWADKDEQSSQTAADIGLGVLAIRLMVVYMRHFHQEV
jgi:hypothetical protein